MELPSTIGPYQIRQRLGSGGMGEVFLAYDQRLKRRVAVKRLRHDRVSVRSRDRLRREARAVASLSHPSIVPIFDLLELGEEDLLVMEYVAGPSLAELRRARSLTLVEVSTYGRQVAEGLAQAHAHGIVHRDLKTENVLVAEGRARILDFGLARRLEPAESEEHLTREGAILGTARVMSPEQAQGLEVGPRSDLFSLGVLLYELLTDRSPFLGRTPGETLTFIVGRSPEPLPETLPGELTRLVFELLEKLPELRPADAGSVARRLEQLAAQLSARAPAFEASESEATELSALELNLMDSPGESTRSASRSPARIWGAASLVVLGISAGAVWLDHAATSTPIPAVAEAPDTTALDAEAWSLLAQYDKEGNIDRAIERFLRLVEAAPSSARAHAGLARAYFLKLTQDSGDAMWLEQARSVARHAVELDDQDAEAHLSLGLVSMRAGKLEQAQTELETALALDPTSAEAQRGLGRIDLDAGRFDAAEATFRRAAELRPAERESYDLLGALYFRTGKMPEAEAAFRRSIEVAPQSVHGYRSLAGVYTVQGRLDDAVRLLERALEIQPTPLLYLNLGTIFFYQGLYPQAAKAYESAIGFPYGANLDVAWANLGDALRQIPHRRGEAPEAFRHAIRLLESKHRGELGTPWYRSQMALYRAKAGQREPALREIEAARDTTEARPLFRLAVACEIAGERQRSLDFLARALTAGFELAEIEREPDLLALRSDPRYLRLVIQKDP